MGIEYPEVLSLVRFLRFRLVEVARSSFRTSGVPSSFHRFALGRELRLQDKFGIARLEVSLGMMIARATLDVYFCGM